MDAIVNGFQGLISGFQLVWNIISNIFGAIGQAFIYINQVETLLIGLIGQMPPYISGFMLATLLISIIYIIIGRVGGHSE